MKISPVFTLCSCLALCYCFLGVASKVPSKDECTEFFQSSKGKPFACTDDYKPVCGTDNETYSNKCMLCAARKETGKDIGIKYHGECKIQDTCNKFSKSLTLCSKQYDPVCGTDGETYTNLCMLCLERHATGKDIDVKHKGECEKKPDVCSKFQEPEKGKPFVCTKEYDPVCGTNHVTYGNKCLFCAARRESQGTIEILHEGKCKKMDECGQFSEPQKYQPAKCTADYRPVCGSDGVTYDNKCLFCAAKRQSGGKITIKHEGPCEQKGKQ